MGQERWMPQEIAPVKRTNSLEIILQRRYLIYLTLPYRTVPYHTLGHHPQSPGTPDGRPLRSASKSKQLVQRMWIDNVAPRRLLHDMCFATPASQAVFRIQIDSELYLCLNYDGAAGGTSRQSTTSK